MVILVVIRLREQLHKKRCRFWRLRTEPSSSIIGRASHFVGTYVPWWRWWDSNPWPPACRAGALPAELHPHNYCFTHNYWVLLFLRLANLVRLVGPSGLEPPTSCLSGTRSNLLSYEPMWLVWLLFSHLVSFDLKESRLLCSPQSMSALNYLPIQSPVKYFRHCRA